MDDKVLQLYSNEAAFVISSTPVTSSPRDVTSAPVVDLVLTETKSQTPLN